MRRKILCCAAVMMLMVGLICGCQEQPKNNASSEKASNQAESTAVAQLGVSEQTPVVANKEDKTVTVLAKVNGKYFKSPTRHALVFKDGKFGDKSVFQAMGDPLTFNKALVEIGAQPGENMKVDTAAENQVDGDILDVEVVTPEKTIDLNDAIIDSKGNKIEMRFGGNYAAAEEYKTGCLACLDSCPVGIVSNHTYKYGAVENSKEVEFFGNEKNLPADGTYVALKFKLRPGTAQAGKVAVSNETCPCENK